MVVFILVVAACAPVMRSTITGPPSPSQMAEFWTAPPPVGSRDLVYGAGGRGGAPDPRAVYEFVRDINHGFSRKMEVRDPSGRKWDVKFEPEAKPEVVSSRVVWAMGYHQLPDYYLPVWALERGDKRYDMPPARFRPHAGWLRKESTWSWTANPFVGTQAFRGLIVLMVVLNNSDLKDDNNGLYEIAEPSGNASQWYVVKDLGATLGSTAAYFRPPRGDVRAFEQESFLRGATGDRVLFAFRGKHQDLLAAVHPEDVGWMCGRLDAVSQADWQQMFRAGGYDDEQTAGFVAKIRAKIAQGMALARGAQ